MGQVLEIWGRLLRGLGVSKPRIALPEDLLEAMRYLEGARAIQLPDYQVVGSYFRFDVNALAILREAKDRILHAPKEGAWRENNNFLVWAPSGVGKSSFARELGRDAERRFELTWKQIEIQHFDTLAGIQSAVNESKNALADGKALLVTVDECDRTVEGQSVMPIFHGPLEWNQTREWKVVWVFIGSGKTREDLIRKIRDEDPKGPDVLRRFGDEQECHITIPPLTGGDKIIIAAAKAAELDFVRAERIALMAIPLDPKLASSGEIDKRIRSVRRTVKGDKLMFTHLFPLAATSTDFYLRYGRFLNPLERLGSVDIRRPPA